MNLHTKRRKRRRAKLRLFNASAVRPHRRKGGRTGRVQAKRTPAKVVFALYRRPNPPVPVWMIGA